MLNEYDLIDDVYNKLFEKEQFSLLNFVGQFPSAEVNREFAQIMLNDKFVIKIERI